jgi:hypothetical protein
MGTIFGWHLGKKPGRESMKIKVDADLTRLD